MEALLQQHQTTSKLLLQSNNNNIEDDSCKKQSSSRNCRQLYSDDHRPSANIEDTECYSDSDEIPIWVRSEKRWISGLTEDTTCGQLVEALLLDEGISVFEQSNIINKFVITERWRRVEQILNNSTKILQIWTAWGEAQSEVKLSLRRIESPQGYYHQNHQQPPPQHHQPPLPTMYNAGVFGDSSGCGVSDSFKGDANNDDSGRESPTASSHSAIVRRKRHRSARSTTAWVTHAQTVHPKSAATRPAIEKLMKLILEQGETIQQQLSKLRDRELEIAKIEEARYCSRDKEQGKNYLLKTYLNCLPPHATTREDETADGTVAVKTTIDEEEIDKNNNSDSGVHTTTSDGTTATAVTPEMIVDADIPSTSYHDRKEHKLAKSKRELKLLQEHEISKEFLAKSSELEKWPDEEECDKSTDLIDDEIEALEKIVTINKRLQNEEELLVRLSARIRRYKSDDPTLSEPQIVAAIKRVNQDIRKSSNEIQHVENEFEIFNEMLAVKSDVVSRLNKELEQLEMEDNQGNLTNSENGVDNQLVELASNQTTSLSKFYSKNDSNLSFDMANSSLREQQHFFGGMLPTPPSITKCANKNSHLLLQPTQHANTANFCNPSVKITDSLQQLLITEAPLYYLKDQHNNSCNFLPPTNYNLSYCDVNQRNLNSSYLHAHNLKVGPKTLIKELDSDTGISSLSEDGSQLGTLV